MRTIIIFIVTFMFELYLFAISRQKHKDDEMRRKVEPQESEDKE